MRRRQVEDKRCERTCAGGKGIFSQSGTSKPSSKSPRSLEPSPVHIGDLADANLTRLYRETNHDLSGRTSTFGGLCATDFSMTPSFLCFSYINLSSRPIYSVYESPETDFKREASQIQSFIMSQVSVFFS